MTVHTETKAEPSPVNEPAAQAQSNQFKRNVVLGALGAVVGLGEILYQRKGEYYRLAIRRTDGHTPTNDDRERVARAFNIYGDDVMWRVVVKPDKSRVAETVYKVLPRLTFFESLPE